MYIWVLVSVLLVVCDQTAKYAVVRYIGANESISVIKGIIDFVYIQNTGGAFSILSNITWVLAVISVIFCMGVMVYFIKNKNMPRLEAAALSLMFAGAAGNAVDRIFRGYVVDFIKTVFIDFPVFNIADIAITTGAVMLVIFILFSDNKKQA